MTNDARDLEMPVGFTGEWKRLGDFTEKDTLAFDRAFDMVRILESDDQAITNPKQVRELATLSGFPVENVREFLDQIAALLDIREAGTEADDVSSEEVDKLLGGGAPADVLPIHLEDLRSELLDLAFEEARRGESGEEIGRSYHERLLRLTEHPASIRGYAASILLIMCDRDRDEIAQFESLPYEAEVGDIIVVDRDDASDRDPADVGLVVSRLPLEVAPAYVYQSQVKGQREVARREAVAEVLEPGSEEARAVAAQLSNKAGSPA